MKMLKFEGKFANWEMETHLLNKFFNAANTELVIAVYADDIVPFFPAMLRYIAYTPIRLKYLVAPIL